ncbi:MAG TPA: AIR synthase-related protein, partial [bacterium]|nr:AIR synthase-related protein [bacterium]
VEKGRGDGIFITTSGIGLTRSDVQISTESIVAGDALILTGTLGDHALAVLKARNQFSLDFEIESDVAPVNGLVATLLDAVPETRFLRDPTRGGVAAVLGETSRDKAWGFILDEQALPITSQVRSLCEILGYDPLTLANEGKVVAVVPADAVEKSLKALQSHPLGRHAAKIGYVDTVRPGIVLLKTLIGGTRVVQVPLGEDLPRIC